MLVKVAQSCPTLCDPMDCIPPGSSVHGILQDTGLGNLPFSRGSSQPRDWIQISCIAGGFFTNWATREALLSINVETHCPSEERAPKISGRTKESSCRLKSLYWILKIVPSIFDRGRFKSRKQKVFLNSRRKRTWSAQNMCLCDKVQCPFPETQRKNKNIWGRKLERCGGWKDLEEVSDEGLCKRAA